MILYELVNELNNYLRTEDYYNYISKITSLLNNEFSDLKVNIPIKLVRLTNKHSYMKSGSIDRLSIKEDGNILIEIAISNTKQFICVPSYYSINYQLVNPLGTWKRGGYTFFVLPNEYIFNKEYKFEKAYKKKVDIKTRLEFLGQTLMFLDSNDIEGVENIAGELMQFVNSMSR